MKTYRKEAKAWKRKAVTQGWNNMSRMKHEQTEYLQGRRHFARQK